jgi:hypothetical protein
LRFEEEKREVRRSRNRRTGGAGRERERERERERSFIDNQEVTEGRSEEGLYNAKVVNKVMLRWTCILLLIWHASPSSYDMHPPPNIICSERGDAEVDMHHPPHMTCKTCFFCFTITS